MTDPIRSEDPTTQISNPPGSWWRAWWLARRALAPVERVLAIEAASGLLLVAVAIIALLWANSPWSAAYGALWHTPIGLRIGAFAFERDLHFWINDGLMTIFFFVVGLEIRREIHCGELSELRRAALPLAAAVGGMMIPAIIFFTLNLGRPTAVGWGIPMATDIAFAVGVLTVLGKRVPPALRVLLLALAVIDDVGAILVIAVFYSQGIQPVGFVAASAGVTVIVLMQLVGVRSPWAYVLPALVLWAGAYVTGIHPTLAGVAVGLMTPVRAWFAPSGFIERANQSVEAIRHPEDKKEAVPLGHLARLDEASREIVSPVERLQHALHGWVAFGVMPLFALANAGVALGQSSLEGDSLSVFLGVVFGLLVGKPIGVVGFAWLATRLGLATLPKAVTWSQVSVVGIVAGVGFTMSIFIAQLAYPAGVNLETAKVGILAASGFAAVLAYGFGRVILSSSAPAGGAATAAEAEASTTV